MSQYTQNDHRHTSLKPHTLNRPHFVRSLRKCMKLTRNGDVVSLFPDILPPEQRNDTTLRRHRAVQGQLHSGKCRAIVIPKHILPQYYSRVSSGSIVSDYGLDDRAIGVRSPAGQRIFPLASVSRPALGPTQPPVLCVPGVLSPGVKARPGRDADHSPPSSAEVKNE
jgi:hypothetical protein